MARASGAHDVLSNAQVFDSIEEALADCHQVCVDRESKHAGVEARERGGEGGQAKNGQRRETKRGKK